MKTCLFLLLYLVQFFCFAQKTIEISASGNTQIDLLGEPKVDLKIFTNTATLSKKIK